MIFSCVVATPREAELADLVAGLKAQGAAVAVVPDGGAVLDAVRTGGLQLVVIDEGLPDGDPIPLVMEVVMVDALINTAVISSLPDSEFHDKSEGLGVLCALPAAPGRADGEALVQQAKRVANLV